MSRIRGYQDLTVWQEAMELVVECYRITQEFPRHEEFGLVAQARRAAVSVPANIAEGNGRARTGDYVNHLTIARGSLMELETHLQIAQRLDYLAPQTLEELLRSTNRIGRMLTALMNSLRKTATHP